MVSRRSAARSSRKKVDIPLSARLSDKDISADRVEKLTTDFRRIRNTLPEMRQTGKNALYVAGKNGFPDSKKAVRIAYSVLYLANFIEKLVKKIEKKCDENAMEELSTYLKTAAFRDFLTIAWNQCRKGDDALVKERYDIITDALKELADSYKIKVLPYSKITKSSAGAGNIKKIEADLTVMPKQISGKEAKGLLSKYAGVEWSEELDELLKMPEELFMNDNQTMFSDKEDFSPVEALNGLFSGLAAEKITEKTGYGMMFEESFNQGYVSFIDTKRRVAVKARIYSQHGEVKGWDTFKTALESALKMAEKSKKNELVVIERSSIRIFDMSKNKFSV